MSKPGKRLRRSVPPARAVDRRAFVRAAGGFVAASALGSCKGISTTDGGAGTGTLEVRVEGLISSPAGAATIVRLGGEDPGTRVDLPTPGADGISLLAVANLVLGVYRVTYDPPDTYVLVDSVDFREVTVEQAAPVQAGFMVESVGVPLETGMLEVYVSGVNPAVTSSAGTAAIITQPDGAPAGSLVMPDQTTGESLGAAPLLVGSYRVTFTPPPGHTGTEPSDFKDVTIAAGETLRVSFLVRELGAPVPLVFASDWPVQGGTVEAAGDNGKWNVVQGDSGMVVVSAAGLGFPAGMTNAFRVEYVGGVARGITKQNGWPLPAVGGVLCRRMYWRMSIPGTNEAQHPANSAFSSGSCGFASTYNHDVGATYMWELGTLVAGQPSPNIHRWRVVGGLTRDVVYRIEEKYTRISDTTWNLQMRIYNANNVLLYEGASFACASGHGTHSLATVPAPIIETPNPECFRHYMIGHQGKYNVPGGYIYYGGFAMSLVDWCGEYRPGEAG